MKFSKLTGSTILIAALFMTACSDDENKTITKEAEFQQTQMDVQPDAQLYKMTQEDGCRIYTLEQDITSAQASEAGVQSPMALCEEKLKPVKNSATEEYDRGKTLYTCFRKSEAKEIIAQTESCYEI